MYSRAVILQGFYVSADLDANLSSWEMLTSLENMPNIGTVHVVETSNSTGNDYGFNTSSWEIIFTSEIGAFPSLEVSETGES